MPSLTTKTWNRRIMKARRMGKARKRLLRRGTTPVFPIHPEVATTEAAGTPQPTV